LPVCLFLSFRYLLRLHIDAFRQEKEGVKLTGSLSHFTWFGLFTSKRLYATALLECSRGNRAAEGYLKQLTTSLQL